MSDFVFATVKYESGDWESAPSLPGNLIDSIARYTSIDVAAKGVDVALGTDEIFNYPFCWFTGHLPVRFTDQERKNLRRYIDHGGFMVMDDHNHDIDGIYHKTLTEEITRTFEGRVTAAPPPPIIKETGVLTKDERALLSPSPVLRPIPENHELYNCFFTFEHGAPNTQHELNGWGDQLIHKNLFAIMEGKRIGLIYSSKDYSSEWNFHPDTKREMLVDPTKFGVNMIVYALTR